MVLKVEKAVPDGSVSIPGSKSHTIRALFFSSLAAGRSVIRKPLQSDDSRSAARVLGKFGAKIIAADDVYIVDGFGPVPDNTLETLDTGNSGTTVLFAASTAALGGGRHVLDGDAQTRKRPVGPLLGSLAALGATCCYLGREGHPPFSIKGPVKGGELEIECMTSQYLSSLLISLPLAEGDSLIIPSVLYEKPYIDMTIWWLDRLGIRYERDGYKAFRVFGGQQYRTFEFDVPGDYSSATFFMALAAGSGGRISIGNLAPDDPQGDKRVSEILKAMGAGVEYRDGSLTVRGYSLKGLDIDLNSMPDALPALAVLGCFAAGTTRLLNVPQARLKETDRIKTMCGELKKMGADIKELEDGLEIRQSRLHAAFLNGHGDHRVVMALSLAGSMCDGITTIDTAESVNITFPDFVRMMNAVGMRMEMS